MLSGVCCVCPHFYFPPSFRHSAGLPSTVFSPTAPSSIGTALVYLSHMWTVDGKMNFTHSRDDERRWETGRRC